MKIIVEAQDIANVREQIKTFFSGGAYIRSEHDPSDKDIEDLICTWMQQHLETWEVEYMMEDLGVWNGKMAPK